MDHARVRTFLLHWRSSSVTQEITGNGESQHTALQNAMMRAGIGGGALRALDYWEETTLPIDASPVEREVLYGSPLACRLADAFAAIVSVGDPDALPGHLRECLLELEATTAASSLRRVHP